MRRNGSVQAGLLLLPTAGSSSSPNEDDPEQVMAGARGEQTRRRGVRRPVRRHGGLSLRAAAVRSPWHKR